ncbi:MAG TPA: SDR family NAD(P)-dependent oxidoreductase, partial [Rectinemataceae bacterium]|nr:SDR family NAD(P)-dependent oxidoreductase [Rectinemataceae bacterium]
MKHVVITGSTSGIGFAAALALAREGWRVIGTGREAGRCAAAEAALRAAAPGAHVDFLAAELASRREVLGLAERIGRIVGSDNEGRLEALVLNAGTVPAWFTVTEDGYETQFAVNHLSGFLLARELEGELRHAGGARIVITSSASHRGARMHWKDPMLRRSY